MLWKCYAIVMIAYGIFLVYLGLDPVISYGDYGSPDVAGSLLLGAYSVALGWTIFWEKPHGERSKEDEKIDVLVEEVADTIQDSLDYDWTPTMGARQVVAMLIEKGHLK